MAQQKTTKSTRTSAQRKPVETKATYTEEQLQQAIAKAVQELFDLRPAAIIKKLKLRKPIYKALAAYGHMGREDLDVSWEKTDMADILMEYFKNR